VTFVDRMTPGLVKITGSENLYPVEVPPLDMVWVWAGPIVVVAGILTWWRCKQSAQSKPVQAQPAVSGT